MLHLGLIKSCIWCCGVLAFCDHILSEKVLLRGYGEGLRVWQKLVKFYLDRARGGHISPQMIISKFNLLPKEPRQLTSFQGRNVEK